MSTEAWRGTAKNELARQVFELCQSRIEDFRRGRPPMPLIVLHAENAGPVPGASDDPDVSVSDVVNLIHEAQAQRGMLVKRLAGAGAAEAVPGGQPGGSGPDGDEAAYPLTVGMLRSLSRPTWTNQRRSQYRGFSFSRSQLMLAIEQATDKVAPPGPDSPGGRAGGNGPLSQEEFEQRLVGELQRMRWQPRRPSEDSSSPDSGRTSTFWSVMGTFWQQLRDTAGLPGGVLLFALVTFLSSLGGIGSVAFPVAAVALLLIGIGAFELIPTLRYLAASSRWFATTTFLASYAAPRGFATWSRWRYGNSWEVIEARACAVGLRIVAARPDNPEEREREKARQFHRELLAIALLEDLRDNFRPHTLDLRGRKRTVPPVVSLPNATRANGGQLLIRTISDVRSRRSEQDPLLVVAGIPAAEAHAFGSGAQPAQRTGAGPSDEAGPSPEALYDSWKMDLSVGQSPRLSTLAWVLRIPLDPGQLTERRSQSVSVNAVRPTLARRLWSWRALMTVLVCIVASGFFINQDRADRYCRGGLLGSNVDSVWVANKPGVKECIGVATGDVRFSSFGKVPGPSLLGSGDGIGLTRIEDAIRKQNAEVSSEYVTLVYAGPLSAAAPRSQSPVKGLEELTGVYLQQRTINETSSVKLKVLLANGGDDMRHEDIMVGRIIGAARKDPSIVGVVGLGRDTTYSENTMARLQQAGLPVVDTTNSGTYLAEQFANYFGMAATDQEQAHDLGLIAHHLAGAKDSKRALVLSRRTGERDHDKYTPEQELYGERMLEQAGYQVLGRQEYSLTEGGDPNLADPVTSMCSHVPALDAMYFAGRVDDLDSLMNLLNTTSGCADHPITIFTGDDVSKADFLQNAANIAPNVTLYYVSLAPMDKGKGMPALRRTAQEAFEDLRPGGKALASNGSPNDPLLDSGQIALAYDATAALHAAAALGGSPQTAAETWANLRAVEVENMATGTVTFTGTVPYQPQDVHGINIIRVGYPAGSPSAYELKVVCGRAAGDRDALTEPQCSSS